uniref:Uncharacterized protein n=1 Tax=viral metagenome TaxID=1070528 RepID=A0A6H1ZX90_9ZZZZ
MSLIEDVPEELRSADKLDEFLVYLRVVPLPLHTKKYLLLDWCEFTGVPMSRELAERVGLPLEI